MPEPKLTFHLFLAGAQPSSQAELGIIGDNLTNRQRINRSTLSIVGYQWALEMALSVCRFKTKFYNRQIELLVQLQEILSNDRLKKIVLKLL